MAFDYPVFFDLTGKKILVIGAGKAAAEKLPRLIASGCRLTVIAQTVSPEVSDLLYKSDAEVIIRTAVLTDINEKFMVFFCVGDSALAKEFREYALAHKILFNSADNPRNCDFFTCSVVDRGSVTIALGTQGKYAGYSAMLRRLANALLPESLTAETEELFNARLKLIESQPNVSKRREALKKAIETIETAF